MNILDKYFGGKIKGKQVSYMLAMIGLIVLVTNGFRYINWPPFWKNFYAILLVIMLIASFMKKNYYAYCNFSGIVLLFILIPFFSIINSSSIFGQSVLSSISALFLITFTWLLYFVLHILKVKESTVLRVLLYISLFAFALQLIQQFTYPNALFGVRNDDYLQEHIGAEKAEMRNGLYRFRVCGSYYVAILIFAIILWLKNRFNRLLMLLLFILLGSIYLFLTRQVIVSMLFTIFVSFFMDKKQNNVIFSIVAVIFVGILLFFSDILFGKLIQQTLDETNEENIRVLASSFFFNESIKTPATFLFGYGIAGSSGAYHNFVEFFSTNLHFHETDVGFIGMMWRYGVLYIILSYYLLYSLFWKYKNIIPQYIRLFVIYVSLMSIMIFPFGTNQSEVIVWPILLYICDLHIKKSKLALKTL